MNVLVTGGTGFVGSHMIDYLLTNVPDVMIYATRHWRSRDENIRHLYNVKQVQFIEADLLDMSSLIDTVSQSKPEYVFHFAAQSFPETSFLTPIRTLSTNVIGTTNLLEVIKVARNTGICNPIVISVSSSEVYGNPLPHEVPMVESNPIRAANPYSISKVGHDLMSQYYYKAFNLKIITTRMFSHEGARRGKKFALSSFAYQIVNHEFYGWTPCHIRPPFPIYVGNLDSVRTYAHISDAVHAYWLAATRGQIGEVYNIGGNYTCTVGEALQNLISKSFIKKEDFKIVVDPARIRPTDITLQIPNCDKFKEHTGWQPTKDLDYINSDLLKYWRERFKIHGEV